LGEFQRRESCATLIIGWLRCKLQTCPVP
jgi:hypothetical protein